MQLQQILNHLQSIAPLEFAETWDNVGLLVGDRNQSVSGAMTCLTLSETSLQEAIDEKVQLVVSHHPIPFKPLQKITSDSTTGKILLKAIESGIAVYSPHTAWDNALQGINQQLAELAGLDNVRPLQAFANARVPMENVGIGRCGELNSSTIASLIERLTKAIPTTQSRHTHMPSHSIRKLGIICGSGGSMLNLVASRGCDAMLTGEATYHQCLEAEAQGIALIMIGHHTSEAFAMKTLAQLMSAQLPSLHVFSSTREFSTF